MVWHCCSLLAVAAVFAVGPTTCAIAAPAEGSRADAEWQAEALFQKLHVRERLTAAGESSAPEVWERGSLRGGVLRWHPSALLADGQWRVAIHETAGTATYEGYTRDGLGRLSPLQSTSKYRLRGVSVQAGWPQAYSEVGVPLHVIPMVQLNQTQWRRQLQSYSEYHSHTDFLLGVRIAIPSGAYLKAAYDWQLEAALAAGRSLHGRIRSPELGANLAAPRRRLEAGEMILSRSLAGDARASLRLACERSRAPASDVQAAFQQPATRSRVWSTGLAVQWHM